MNLSDGLLIKKQLPFKSDKQRKELQIKMHSLSFIFNTGCLYRCSLPCLRVCTYIDLRYYLVSFHFKLNTSFSILVGHVCEQQFISAFVWKCHNLSFIFEGSFVACRILISCSFSFSTLNMVSHCLWATTVSDGKSRVNIIMDLLYMVSHFSLTALKSHGSFVIWLSTVWLCCILLWSLAYLEFVVLLGCVD